MSSIARKTKAKGQKHKKKKEIAIKTPKEDLLVLRRALRDENGKDRNGEPFCDYFGDYKLI